MIIQEDPLQQAQPVEEAPSQARERTAGGTSGAEQDVVDGLRERQDGKRPDLQGPEYTG